MNRIAQQHMRYSPPAEAIRAARKFHERAFLASAKSVDKAANNFGLATLDIAEGKLDDAANHFVTANTFVNKYASYDNNFSDTIDYKLIKRLSPNVTDATLQSEYDEVFGLLAKKETEKYARDAVARAKSADEMFDEAKLLNTVRMTFDKIIRAFNGDDISSLSNITTPEFAQKLRAGKQAYKDARQIQHVTLKKIKSAVISDVSVADSYLTATVMLVSEQINYITDPANVPLRGESVEPDEKQDSFTFVRRRGDDAEAWRLKSMRGLD